LREWAEAARLEPNNMHTQWAYANLLGQTGKISEAEALYRRIAQSGNQVLAPEATKALVRINQAKAPDPHQHHRYLACSANERFLWITHKAA
jgi:hypothetical protein